MDIYEERRAKVDRLRSLGITPYASQYDCSHTVQEAVNQPEGTVVRIAGRLMSRRSFGKLIFGHLQDRSGKGQISLKKGQLSETQWLVINEVLDIGDFIGIEGVVWVTKTGERTIDAQDLTFLSKGLRQLPEKWHGVKNREIMYRQRYLDLVMNPATRERFVLRSRVISLIRRFLEDQGFLEVETPVLQTASSGAAARPFMTHHNALDQDLYLRISPETYLKRLVVGGMERVFEFAKNFRNEGIDISHLQEFTMLEWYVAYWDYTQNMKFLQALIQFVLMETRGTLVIEYQGTTLDFSGDWPVIDFRDAVKQETGIDILEYTSHDDLAQAVQAVYPNFDIHKYASYPSLVDALYKQTLRPKLIQPCFLIHHPTELVPLARRSDADPKVLDMFQVVVNSWEIVKAYSELIDPVDQYNRMVEQTQYRDQGDDETMMMEDDYIECMEYGMPPISGLGLGIDRLVALMTDQENLKDVVFFPHLRSKRDEAGADEESSDAAAH
jgi:lysyl-tRNA synthetase, class II